MFVRFINHKRDGRSHQKRGVFQIAYGLMQADEIPFEQWYDLKAGVRWFEQPLLIPRLSRMDQLAKRSCIGSAEIGQTVSLAKLATENKDCKWIYRFGANPGMPRGGIVPPTRSWHLGRRSD